MDENEVKEVEQNENINNDTEVTGEKNVNTCGLLSFIFSLVGLLVFGMPLGVAAIILGIVSIVKFDANKQKFKWMGIVGICVGVVDVIGVIMNMAIVFSNLSGLY